MERCENCQRTIGDLEETHLWREHVVCRKCRQLLDHQQAEPARPAARTLELVAGDELPDLEDLHRLMVEEAGGSADTTTIEPPKAVPFTVCSFCHRVLESPQQTQTLRGRPACGDCAGRVIDPSYEMFLPYVAPLLALGAVMLMVSAGTMRSGARLSWFPASASAGDLGLTVGTWIAALALAAMVWGVAFAVGSCFKSKERPQRRHLIASGITVAAVLIGIISCASASAEHGMRFDFEWMRNGQIGVLAHNEGRTQITAVKPTVWLLGKQYKWDKNVASVYGGNWLQVSIPPGQTVRYTLDVQGLPRQFTHDANHVEAELDYMWLPAASDPKGQGGRLFQHR